MINRTNLDGFRICTKTLEKKKKKNKRVEIKRNQIKIKKMCSKMNSSSNNNKIKKMNKKKKMMNFLIFPKTIIL